MSDGYKRLPVKLDESEKAERSEELARELWRRGELMTAKKEAAQRSARQIKDLDKHLSGLVEAVNTGIEYRDVPVREEVRGMRMETIRCDTWETVSSRPLEDHERQTSIPVDLGEHRARKRKASEPPTDDDKTTH